MAKEVALGNLEKELESRALMKIRRYSPNDPRLREALLRIGIMLEAQIKMNIQFRKLIDTGRLLNSIRYELRREGSRNALVVGSFGVPYAAIHEFGGKTRNVKARPYLRPAIKQKKGEIIKILTDLLKR